tara:strand:- start:1651 stop:3645 length:1995 start_codon:yes stop_codon:yes gene_type:complete
VADEVDMANYFGQYKGATGGLLPGGIASEMGKAGQYLAGGMQQLGAGLGKGLEDYRKNKEKKEILTERAEWIADQKEAELEQWLQADPSKIDTPDGDQKVKEIQKFRDKIHSSSTSQLTSIVANEMLEYERQGKELERQLKQNQIDAYDRKVTQDDAAADVYGAYKKSANQMVPETMDVDAVYQDTERTLPSINSLIESNVFSGTDQERPTYQERTAYADEGRIAREIDGVIDSKNKAIKDILKANTDEYRTRMLHLMYKQPGHGTEAESEAAFQDKLANDPVLFQGDEAVEKLKSDIQELEFDKEQFLETGETGDLSEETRNKLQSFRGVGSLDPVQINASQAALLNATQGEEGQVTDRELVSPAGTKTVERPKTVGERRQLLEGLIAERAGDLGVAGIKSVKELSKSVQPEVQKIGGFNYIVSPTGAFQLLPGQEQGAAATPAQIKAMAAMGYKPKTATLKMGNGLTMQMEVPPANDGTKRTENQAAAYLHQGLMGQSEAVIENLEDTGQFDASDLTESFELYHDVNVAKSPEAKQYAAAMNKWIEGYLRYVSGAAIAEHEYKGARSQFFPVVGDSEENKAIKKTRRATTVKLLKEISGGGDVKKLIDHAASLPGGGINLVGRGAATPEEAVEEAVSIGMQSGQSFRWYNKETGKFHNITLD